jgi:hypothetical protein
MQALLLLLLLLLLQHTACGANTNSASINFALAFALHIHPLVVPSLCFPSVPTFPLIASCDVIMLTTSSGRNRRCVTRASMRSRSDRMS